MKKHLTVYCGSSTGSESLYTVQSKALAKEMVSNNFHLMYGAGNVGLMGIIADEIMSLGGETVGVIPQHLMDREVGHNGLTELIVTQTMHERKKIMAERTSGFIAMPGGVGTLEEIIEVMTWSQLDLHPYPVCFYNVNGYYDKLFDFMKHMVNEGFLKQFHVDKLILESNPAKLINKIQNYKSKNETKWL
ncbi:MAG: hypothetical protein ACI9P5_003271 [Saprospiraceae bacterium]|jgi:uncharacterized protein (TIGR00730 family)|tara:strand:+ start:153 stop:722 length:570 start_codon:yes stop_codon:yes gene_type:complete